MIRYIFLNTKCLQTVLSKSDTILKLFYHLVRTHNQMSFRNCKLAHTSQAVHFTGILITEQCWCLTITAWQVTIGFLACLVNIVLEWTGHRTKGKYFLILFLIAKNKHTFFVVIPVTGNLVQIRFRHQRCLRSHVTALFFLIFNPALQSLNNLYTFWHQKRKSLTDYINGSKQFQLTSQFIVVAFFNIFQMLQIGIQIRFLCISSSVYTGKHFIFLISSPVSTGRRNQLHCL